MPHKDASPKYLGTTNIQIPRERKANYIWFHVALKKIARKRIQYSGFIWISNMSTSAENEANLTELMQPHVHPKGTIRRAFSNLP